ncbi:MAG: hypothetical protein WA741_09240 [Candidatus Sulfotelmatobacter sp.]
MANLTPSFLNDVEKAIKHMQSIGMVPSIQRLEVMMKRGHGAADSDMIRQATEELLEQKRIQSLPLDQPDTAS